MNQLLIKFGITMMVCLSGLQLHAQESFICRGNYYLALTDGPVFTTLYEVTIDPNTGNAAFDPISTGTSGSDLNAIGYRYSDNYIYGVHSSTFELYRVGTDGVVNTLSSPITDIYYLYNAGDVSPDSRYLVVIATSSFQDEILLFIDLDSPTYEYTELMLSGPDVRSSDIAFDPIDGKLYGFDGIHQRLVTYDIQTGVVTAAFPSTTEAVLMGGLFFDPFGNLYGYGLAPGENVQQAFYSIDKLTGVVTLESMGPPVSRNDGCSCPYTVALQETVDPMEVIPCTEVPITIEIANTSKGQQNGLRLEQTFPESFVIVGIDDPLGGNLTAGGPGTNFFVLEGLSVPRGMHEIIVTVELQSDASGTYAFQAMLSGLPPTMGSVTVSDNPLTLLQLDSSSLNVGPLNVDFSEINTQVCTGAGIVLDPNIPGASYLWSDGSTGPTFTVTEGGIYAVTISTGCETVEETINVDGFGFQLDLGQDLQIDLGESLKLQPEITPSTAGLTYSWTSSTDPLPCDDCFEPLVTPHFDTWYYLTARDADGCFVSDSVFVAVLKNRDIYIPNTFSPNDDGINDRFYLQSKHAETILEFKIFDRWGNLLFDKTDAYTNDPAQGWDGRFRGKVLPNGLFSYLATIRFLDGEVVAFRGGVAILR